jgi:hypothetical protein
LHEREGAPDLESAPDAARVVDVRNHVALAWNRGAGLDTGNAGSQKSGEERRMAPRTGPAGTSGKIWAFTPQLLYILKVFD